MTDLIDLPVEIAENRRLEEAHDLAMKVLDAYWIEEHGDNRDHTPMYHECTNGDSILCEEAQDVFNGAYTVELDR